MIRLFFVFNMLSICTVSLKSQVIRVQTTPQGITNQIPGFSQISTINTITISYTPATPISQPSPIDGGYNH